MNKMITFYNQIDYLTEAEHALRLIAASKKDFESFKHILLQKYGVDSEHSKNCLALLEKIRNRMVLVFEDKMEQIRNLFGEIEQLFIPAELILCWNFLVPANSPAYKDTTPLKTMYKKLTLQEKDEYFLRALLQNAEEEHFKMYTETNYQDLQESDAKRICQIFSYIQSMDIKTESKLRIQDMYLKRDIYFEQILTLLDETIPILKEFEDDMQKLLKVWETYWKKIIEEGQFFETIRDVLDIEDSMLENGFCIIPSFIQAAALLLFINDTLIQKKEAYMLTCRIGIMLTDEFHVNHTKSDTHRVDEMIPVWKVLGDKSKFDILLYIKNKPAYGSELAKQFSLTTATVSHHMNKLLQLGLVQADLKNGRLYYQTRKDVIQNFFDEGKRMFL